MDDYMDWKNEKEDSYMLCDRCGDFAKYGKMFVKSYKNTAFSLCRNCARKLQQEINEYIQSN